MDTIGCIGKLLEEKNTKFLAYEQATLEMLHCDVDAIENYIIKRGELANEIDACTEEIGRVCDKEPNGKLLFQAALAQINYEMVPPDMYPLYELGQQILGVASRVRTSDGQVLERLETLKQDALAKIKENQNLPKIKKYLVDLGENTASGSFTSGKA